MAKSVFSSSGKFSNLQITSGVKPTGKILGAGSDATVVEVDYGGTLCAAKEVHAILLRDQSPGGAERFIANFLKECKTWSTLSHPQIVQLLGFHWKEGSCVPMLILEKMDTSLRNYLEVHKKEELPLPDKVYVLRQVAQGLSYLHSLSPPLVHHDLSPNNVLLSDTSLQTKVTDFGMSRALDPSKMARKTSIKGTQAFMAPEALVESPKYDEKLDTFSFGNIIITTLTHLWPNPGQPTILKGKKLIAVNEVQRRQLYLDQFTPKESELFLPVVRACLQNDPSERPTSNQLVTQMGTIEEAHPRVPDSVVISQLRQTLDEKDKQLQCKDQQLKAKDQQLQAKNQQLQAKDLQLQAKDDKVKRFILELGQQCEEIKLRQQQRGQHLQERTALKTERDHYYKEIEQLQCRLCELEEELRQQPPVVKKVATKPSRNWRDMKCQKVLKCGGRCWSVATKGDLIAVGVGICGICQVEVYDKKSNKQLHVIGRDVIQLMKCELDGTQAPSVAFLDEETIVVSDRYKHNLKLFTFKGKLLHTIDRGRTTFTPQGVTVSPNGHMYVCDVANHCVCVFDVKGKFLFSFGSRGSVDECFSKPRDLCFASDSLLYITDVDNSRICVYAKNGTFIRKFPTTCKPTCIDATDCGHLIVSSWSSHKVMIYTTGGQLVVEFGEDGSGLRQLKSPCGVSVDRDGLVYIAEWQNNRTQIW